MAATFDTSAEYHGNRLIIFTAIYIPVQVFCVALRYVSRYMVEGPWGLDDAVVLTSLALQICMAGISIGEQWSIITLYLRGVGTNVMQVLSRTQESDTIYHICKRKILKKYYCGANTSSPSRLSTSAVSTYLSLLFLHFTVDSSQTKATEWPSILLWGS